MRTRVIALVAALLANAVVTVALAADPSADAGGSTAGAACRFEVASTEGVFGATATIVPFELFHAKAENWAPNGEGSLVADKVGSDLQETFDVVFSAGGSLLEGFLVGQDGAGTWLVTLSQPDPPCEVTVEIRVLPLGDLFDSKFLEHIKWLFLEGITSGCTPTAFCPNGLVTRGQMATFLARALSLPATGTDYFTDDETNKHEANINRLREAGITFGCTATTFCPDGLVTRAQMASFLARAFELTPTDTDYFTDDEGNKHEANINAIRANGLTLGCGGTNFCPNGRVTRGQLAAFLHRQMED